MFVGTFLFASIAISFATPSPERIIGGENALIEELPYQVALIHNGVHTCGGSIIHENWIITAAHCLQRPMSEYTIRVGTSTRNAGGAIHAVAEIINHENFSIPNVYSHDAGLARLAFPMSFSAAVQPIALPEEDEEIPTGELCLISGWGTLSFGGSHPTQLQKALVPKVSLSDCRRSYGTSSISADMFCAGRAGVDACQGDDGGPLVYDNKLFGIVSWGVACAWGGFPKVYTRVPTVRGWIREKTGV